MRNISVHWHNCFEFDIVLQGSGVMLCNGKEYSVRRGMVCFLSPTDFHEYQNCDQMDLINIQFSENDLRFELLNQFISLRTNVVYADEAKLASIDQLCRLLGTMPREPQARIYDKNLLECLIVAFLNCCQRNETPSHETSRIQRAILYIHAHFKENPPMSEVAALYAYDPNYFCRLFKKSTGVSYKAYLRTLKLEYGMKLIRYTDLPIIEIAAACGYETQSHFNREFKARYQSPPSSYRKSNSKGRCPCRSISLWLFIQSIFPHSISMLEIGSVTAASNFSVIVSLPFSLAKYDSEAS